MKGSSYQAFQAAAVLGDPEYPEPPERCEHGHKYGKRFRCQECKSALEMELHPPCVGCGERLERPEMTTCANYPKCAEWQWEGAEQLFAEEP